jgi:hypothetical protein
VSEFEDRLRAIAKEISRSVERNIDDVAETFGVDADRARQFAEAAGQWLNDHVEGNGEELFGRTRPAEPSPPEKGEKAEHAEPARTSRGPSPLDLPTGAQGLALSALDSGRWIVRPGSNLLSGTGEGADPAHASELVSELRARDWIKADGELTLVGRRALGRWCDSAEPVAAPASPPAPEPPASEPAAPAAEPPTESS